MSKLGNRDQMSKMGSFVASLLSAIFKLIGVSLSYLEKIIHKSAKFSFKHSKQIAKKTHHHVAKRPHNYLMERGGKYAQWHGWNHHQKIHYTTLSIYILVIGAFLFSSYQHVLASGDLVKNWDFTTSSDYTYDDTKVETNVSSARLKAQNYTTDANTVGLYHMDEVNGTTVADSSGNNGNGTLSGGTFGAGQLNNALNLNGTNTKLSVPDSDPLSFNQQNTIEAWTKFPQSFNAGSTHQRQSVVDKGDYQLYFDNETGKLTYELADSAATNWEKVAGNDQNGSWDLDGNLNIESANYIGNKLYVGTGNGTGDAEVWRWNGTSWTQIGGDGINNCWPSNTFETVTVMANDGTNLYVGLGATAGDAEVWKWNGTTWSKLGGDALNSSWPVSTYEYVYSLTYMSGKLYAGLGATAGDAEVWVLDSGSWNKIGGDSINSGWATTYEGVYSLTNDGTNVYAGLGLTAGDAEVWKWNGTTWGLLGGDGVNSSWANTTYEQVLSMTYVNSKLYVGLGSSANDAEVWVYSGTSWSQIGGDSLNSGWTTNYEGVYSLNNDGTNVYAGLGLTAGDNEIWKWNGSSWSKIGGDGVNSGFSNTHIIVNSMAYGDGKLYAGLNSASSVLSGQVWSFDGSSWERIGGDYVNFSWGYRGLQSVEVLQVSGEYLYAGTGVTSAGNAMVWRFDGTKWELIGGQNVNNGWGFNTYESVTSMGSMGGDLYVGLGNSANDAEVWKWNGTTWSQVGGDSLNGGWTTNFEEVNSMATYNNTLYAGLGNSANDAEVWAYNGTNWSKIGGDSINSGWTTNYERVTGLSIYEGVLYAGLGSSAGDAEVWSYSGSSWTKVGGDGVASSWNTVYEQVDALSIYGDKLIAGLGTTTGDAEVWSYDGSTWSQIGGDDINSSWTDGTYERARTLSVYDGKLYVGLGNSTGDGEVWNYDGSSWQKVAGNSINSGWGNTIEEVGAFSPYRGRLYAGIGNTANADASVWAYGKNGYIQSAKNSFDDKWHHVAATYNGTTMKLFVDGSENASQTTNLLIPNGNNNLLIGSSYGGREYGKPRGFLNGQIDELRISNTARTGFTSKPYATTKTTIEPKTADYTSNVKNLDSFTADANEDGGSIKFRLSNDGGQNWKYWDGDSWEQSGSLNEVNTQTEINDNIATLPVDFAGIKWQAVITSDGDQRGTLNSVTITATSDYDAPSSNAANIAGKRVISGADLNTNEWTNGGSPYFSWDAATDSDSGVLGYCLYLGQTSSANPITTKGLLGSSPISTDSHCQFIIGTNHINLADSGLLGSPLTTSNSAYYLNIKAIDRAGNVYSTSQSFHFRFDNTPPTNPGYITAPSGFINTKDATLTWSTSGGQAPSDDNSGIAGLQYKINNASWYGENHSGTGDMSDLLNNDGSYQTTDPPDYGTINEGINNVYFRTWDQAGNVTNTYVTGALKVNTNGSPSEPQNLTANPSTNTTNSFEFNWELPASFVGDAANLRYCYSVNAEPSPANCSFTSSRNLSAGPYASQPGQNTLYVVARDESNNINYSNYSSVNFTANTPAPGIATNIDIVDVSIKSTAKWRLALTWEPPLNGGAGISNYKIYRSSDGQNYSFVGSSSSTTYIDAGLNQQNYFYRVTACDSTNNCSANSSSVSLTPTGKFTEPAAITSEPKTSQITTKKATVNWTTDRASNSTILIGTKSGQYSPSEVSSSNQVTDHELKLDNLSAGTTYYYKVKWTDEDGNAGNSQENTFATSPAPIVKEVEATNISLSSATISFTVKGAHSASLFYGQSDSFGGVEKINTSPAESRYKIDLIGINDGQKYYYAISTYDLEGNEYKGNVFSFTTPPRPKINNLSFQPVQGEPTSTQEVTWATNVPSTSALSYGRVGEAPIDIQDSPLKTEHKIVIKDLQDDSKYTLVAMSRDADGNLATSDRQEFKTALDTRPPKVSSSSIEPSIRGTGAEARGQIIVSWKTDEPSSSQVEYAEGSEATDFNSKTTEDSQLTTEHIVVVSDLPTSRVYSIRPVSRDSSKNGGRGESESAIIGRANESVLTVIFNTLQRVFGL